MWAETGLGFKAVASRKYTLEQLNTMSTKQKTKINVTLLREIAAKAIKYPETIEMRDWGMVAKKDKEHPCGAVGCIAGTAVLMTDKKEFRKLAADSMQAESFALEVSAKSFALEVSAKLKFRNRGTEILGLTKRQAEKLFLVEEWPYELAQKYKWAETKREEAQIIAERIELFIKTNGRE